MSPQTGKDEVVRGFATAGGIIGLLVIAFLNAVACYLVVALATPAAGSPSDYVKFVAYSFVVGNVSTAAGAIALALKGRWGLAYGLILLTVPVCFGFVQLVRCC
jgi:hypothetical protein